MAELSQDFAERVWTLYHNETGFYMFKSDEHISDYIMENESRGLRYVSVSDSYNTLDDRSRLEISQATGSSAKGVFIPIERDVPVLLQAWRKTCRQKNIFPIIFFKSSPLKQEPVSSIITHTCYDMLFLNEILPPEYTEIFRDNRERVVAKNTNGVLPILDKIDHAFRKWVRSKNILLATDQFFAYSAYSPYHEPEKCKFEDISSERGENCPYRCVVIHNIGIDLYEIRTLQNLGFIWNRNLGAWVVNVTKVDTLGLSTFITEVSLPSQEELGFVPEWLAIREEAKALEHIKRTGSFNYARERRISSYQKIMGELLRL